MMRFLAGCGAIRFGVEVGLLCPVRAFPMLFVRACLGKCKSFSERKSLAGCWRRAVCHFLLSYQDRSFAKTASGQAEGREWWGTTKVICVLFFVLQETCRICPGWLCLFMGMCGPEPEPEPEPAPSPEPEPAWDEDWDASVRNETPVSSSCF